MKSFGLILNHSINVSIENKKSITSAITIAVKGLIFLEPNRSSNFPISIGLL
jgi:hypothetical protein